MSDIRGALVRETDELLDGIVLMGSKVEQAILDAVEHLKNRDLKKSKKLYARDKKINKLRYELEEKAIQVIALQQPVAGDVRKLVSILEVITELERMGDYAKGIARISLLIGEDPLIKPLIDLPKMAELTASMLNRSVKAFADFDAEAAKRLPFEDDAIDDLYNKIYRELIKFMMKDEASIDQANQLLWAAHNLERVADRSINICERTIYVVTGEMGDFDPEGYEFDDEDDEEE